jgi:hypothetical protein
MIEESQCVLIRIRPIQSCLDELLLQRVQSRNVKSHVNKIESPPCYKVTAQTLYCLLRMDFFCGKLIDIVGSRN